MPQSPDGTRQVRNGGHKPRRSRGIASLGWLTVIAAAAVIPYLIAQATHGKTEPTTVGIPTAPVASTSSAVIGGASAPVTIAPSPSAAATTAAPASTAAATTTPSAANPIPSPTVLPVEPNGGNGSTPPGGTPVTTTTTYAVKPGDSLWSIAVSRGASGNAAITAMVAQIYADNRSIIGANPSLLRPGQVLTLSS